MASFHAVMLSATLLLYALISAVRKVASALSLHQRDSTSRRLAEIDERLKECAAYGSSTTYESWLKLAAERDIFSGLAAWRGGEDGLEEVETMETRLDEAQMEGPEALIFSLRPLLKRVGSVDADIALAGPRHVDMRHLSMLVSKLDF